jgi:hypothetical protein
VRRRRNRGRAERAGLDARGEAEVSAGRNLSVDIIYTTEKMRTYAGLLFEFETDQANQIASELIIAANRLEALIYPILTFENEAPKLLTAGEREEV